MCPVHFPDQVPLVNINIDVTNYKNQNDSKDAAPLNLTPCLINKLELTLAPFFVERFLSSEASESSYSV